MLLERLHGLRVLDVWSRDDLQELAILFVCDGFLLKLALLFGYLLSFLT